MRARIFQHPRDVSQSGTANTDQWALEWEPAQQRRQDALMGWFGSGDTRSQLRLHFPTREDAVAYAEREGIPHDVELSTNRIRRPKSYADNFRSDRRQNWTH